MAMPAGKETGASTASTGKPLLFDLSAIDLSSRAIGRDQIARMNPHRGQMALLDYVVWHLPDYTSGVGLKLNRPEEFWVAGHFPHRPMLPGVVMVEAAAQLAVYLYNIRFPKPKIAAFTRLENCSFRNPVSLGDELYLLCKETKFSARRFATLAQGLVNNRLAFECEITGMTID